MVGLLRPRNIVELGTRDGESTRALRQAASELGVKGLSVDLSSAPNENQPALGEITILEDWQEKFIMSRSNKASIPDTIVLIVSVVLGIGVFTSIAALVVYVFYVLNSDLASEPLI